MLVIVCMVCAFAGAACADFTLQNGDFEQNLNYWTKPGDGTIFHSEYGNKFHFFGYEGDNGDTTITQLLGDGLTRSTGAYTISASRLVYDNQMKLGLKYWLTADRSDAPQQIWLDWDTGDTTNKTDKWKPYLGGPITGNFNAQPYWIEVEARLCKLGTPGDCHNFIDDIQFTTAKAVPEPASVSYIGLGLVGLAASRFRRRK